MKECWSTDCCFIVQSSESRNRCKYVEIHSTLAGPLPHFGKKLKGKTLLFQRLIWTWLCPSTILWSLKFFFEEQGSAVGLSNAVIVETIANEFSCGVMKKLCDIQKNYTLNK